MISHAGAERHPVSAWHSKNPKTLKRRGSGGNRGFLEDYRKFNSISQARCKCASTLQPRKTSASSATSAVLILKVFAPCDDFLLDDPISAFVFQCPRFSAGERKLKYPVPWFWIQPGMSGPNRTHLFFAFVFSVSPCLRGAKVLFFGCGPAALHFRF